MACSLIGVSRTRSRPELVEQALGQLEHAPGRADVLAQQHDRRVALHLAGDARGHGRAVGQSPPRRAPVGPDLGLQRPRDRARARCAPPARPRRPWPPRRRRSRPAVAASTPSASQARPVASGSGPWRATPASSSSGRYLPGSAREWPPWRYVSASISDGPSPARARASAARGDRVHGVRVVAVDDDRLQAVGRRPVRRRAARPRSRCRSRVYSM